MKIVPARYKQAPCLRLENEALRLLVLPGRGGNIASLFDKRADRELLYQRPGDVLRPVPGSAMYLGDSVQLRIDQDGELAPQARPSDLELGFQIDAAGKLATWNWNTNGSERETLPKSSR